MSLIPITSIQNIRHQITTWRKQNLRIGLIPTMGYLHEGHMSMVPIARQYVDRVVVSIFVNPTQFGPQEDFHQYPRDVPRDINLCSAYQVDAVFYPTTTEIYPEPSLTQIHIKDLDNHLCGQSRPGHFDGVCLIVNKLFNILQPDFAFFGQKDIQQLLIVQRMVKDLNIPVEVIACPTVRDTNGLALSSRNRYLDKHTLQEASSLYQSLQKGKVMIKAGERNTQTIVRSIQSHINQCSPLAKIDYISIVDMHTLQTVESIQSPVVIALAVYFGQTRLIDNMVLAKI